MKSDPINDTMINYEDTENDLPTFEDPESQPLVRRTLNKDFKSEMGIDHNNFARRSCPEQERKSLAKLLRSKGFNEAKKHKLLMRLNNENDKKSSFSVSSDTQSTITL